MTRCGLTRREGRLVESKDIARLSTISRNGWPHSIPVSYVYRHKRLYVPSNGRAKKVRNLRRPPIATMVIDDEVREHGVMLECHSKVLERARAERLREYMRTVKGWTNDQTTVVIELRPLRKASWFLK